MPLAPLPSPELPSLSSPHSSSPLSSPLSSLVSIDYFPSSSSLSARPPSVLCAGNVAWRCEGFPGRTCSAARKCPSRPSPGVRGRKSPQFMH